MEFSTIWLFVIAAATLLIIPGPAVFYIMARSIDQGKKAGLVSVLGVSLGGSVHVLAGAIGVSAILMTSATAFNIVKYLGAAYLIYLGCKTLFSTSDRTTSEIPKAFHKKSRVLIIQYNPEWIATTPCSNVRRFVSHTERPRCFAGPALAPQSGRVSSL